MDVCVVGLGKLGSCLAAFLADAGHKVIGYDSDPEAMRRIRANEPSPEPLLNDMIAHSGDALEVNNYLDEAVYSSEMTFAVVPTPSLPNGHFDSLTVEQVALDVHAASAGRPHTLVVCSTVSPGTMGRLAERYEDDNFQVVYSPFFIALGQIITDMANPDFRLIGSVDYAVGRLVGEVLSTMDDGRPWSSVRIPIRYMGLAEAEVTKLAVNAYLVTKAAYANTIAMACMNEGIDSRVVMQTVGMDRRIGPAFLTPGAPPGGPCLPRDSKALQAWLQSAEVPSPLPSAVSHTARVQVIKVLDFLESAKVVGILGVAYKPGTPVIEGSLGWTMAQLCDSRGQTVLVHDPLAVVSLGKVLPNTSVEEVIATADVLLVATDHDEYRGLDTKGVPTLDMWQVVAEGDNVTFWGRG